MEEVLRIRGAREHNLKNIDLDLPRNKLIVVTGVSGSGKSSLVFDTIYAEGHRRYVESLSTYARQFLERVDKPDVDVIEGISPAIAFEQKNPVKHSRSTVGTATEIYDYLRLLYSKIGKVICPSCGREVRADRVDEVVREVMTEYPGQRAIVTFPARCRSKSAVRGLLPQLLSRGFIRIILGDDVVNIEPNLKLSLRGRREIEVVVDRLALRQGASSRLADSLETAFSEGNRVAYVRVVGKGTLKFSQDYRCIHCDIAYERPSPKFFSFNSPHGACPECRGFGNILDYDMDLIVPDKNKSLAERAIEAWNKPRFARHFDNEIRKLARTGKVDIHKPFRDLTPEELDIVMNGNDHFRGIIPFFKRLETKKYKLFVRVFTRRYQSTVDCHRCRGARIREDALHVKVGGLSIAEVSAMTAARAREFFQKLKLDRKEQEIAKEILKQIRSRLDFMNYVGLDYLTLDRQSKTLSGGEAQRVNLAHQLGSQLVGTLYVLDEPTIGLHPRDSRRLLDILKKLKRAGNTVIVVEHDRDVISSADHVVDLGPMAGEQGGEVVYQGRWRGLLKRSCSITASYIAGEKAIPIPSRRRKPTAYLYLTGACENNLKGINLRFPLESLTCVTGVSGSGKSTLVHDTLYNALNRIFHSSGEKTGKFSQISGFDKIRDVVLLDQKPIGKSPRSNPITYMKGFDPIRRIFASTALAQARGYGPGHFSFNVDGGRCETCRGEGFIKIEMHFMADMFVKCGDCGGTRFKKELLEVKCRGKSIHDVLQMTAEDALAFFGRHSAVKGKLDLLCQVGLSYLRLGQPATTLSGGEAQRLKIAAELGKKNPSGLLYILDEPTTGLHFDDINRLLTVLNRLVDMGNTVIVVEHNMDVIKTADHIIDLGPEGGEEGGYVVAEGTPEEVMKNDHSHTGRYLREYLKTA